MNSDTNHLVDSKLFDAIKNRGEAKGYEPVPPHLYEAAARKLAGQPEATVARDSGGKLSRYAAQRRKEKAKARRQQRRSRARNR